MLNGSDEKSIIRLREILPMMVERCPCDSEAFAAGILAFNMRKNPKISCLELYSFGLTRGADPVPEQEEAKSAMLETLDIFCYTGYLQGIKIISTENFQTTCRVIEVCGYPNVVSLGFDRLKFMAALDEGAFYEDSKQIKGPTYAKLMRAIEEFPLKYPNYKTNPPKLDDDVRPWMVKSFGCTKNKEDHVFGRIVKEHFQLKD